MLSFVISGLALNVVRAGPSHRLKLFAHSRPPLPGIALAAVTRLPANAPSLW